MGEIGMIVARNLKKYRELKGKTQKDIGNLVGAKDNTVSNWETGRTKIDIEVLFEICKYLEVDLNQMFGMETISTLNEKEQKILNAHRNSDEVGKEMMYRLATTTAKASEGDKKGA